MTTAEIFAAYCVIVDATGKANYAERQRAYPLLIKANGEAWVNGHTREIVTALNKIEEDGVRDCSADWRTKP